MRRALPAIGRWIGKTFDLRDGMLAAGLTALACGLWQVWPPAALIVPGAIISAVAIFAGRIHGGGEEG
ncbi:MULTISPECIES: hypothetical protein [unclassified Bradyrhizobium]|uniref:hypothetical protein n=1 Tax=unclassified Bradyrhizobium TaxID=2631580 RepID=UPI001FF8F094|nr:MULTISPECIES: hypothetical protein [unclassified Bradyrhizobium]MCK1536867.1 hypothetical protein [Bradyrhizobium sp. 176]MCK1560170.1 hypothetical protein [Bradyrhizobium sp. 171]